MKRAKPYHHGDLREALLNASLQLISEVGPKGFTLREVARRAGVSHNAPYRHFRSKDDLLAAVSTEGYLQLDQAMRAASEKDDPSLVRLKNAGLAYVKFALRKPEHFTVMFDAPWEKWDVHWQKHKYPETGQAASQAFHTLLNFVAGSQDEGTLPRGDTRQLALLTWTMVHGVAKLAITGRLPYSTRIDVIKFAEYVVEESLPKTESSATQCKPKKPRDRIESIPDCS